MDIRIGTSGFSYHDWVKLFYPKEVKQRDWLSYYSRFFDTVEINVTFYRTPGEQSFEKWYSEVPKDFLFAVKGSRYVTHIRRLNVQWESIEYFLNRSGLLREKLGPLLWQLPPNLKYDFETLRNFASLLKKTGLKNALEPRHISWFALEPYEILKENNIALVFSDSLSFPKREVMTADFVYIRFHGGSKLYSSEYSQAEMSEWAKKIKEWSQSRPVFAYFNNDANAFAVKNAQQLKTKS